MANWSDANLRNHVSGSNKYSMSSFNEDFSFVNESNDQYYPFIEKDLFAQPNIVYDTLNFEKFDKYSTNLIERTPRYSFRTTSNNKPMQDAYFAFGNQALYQLLLVCNNIWNLLEYDGTNLPKVLVPTKYIIQNLFRDLMHENHSKSMKELTKSDEIENAVRQVIVNSEIDSTLLDALAEKLNVDIHSVEKRLKSPLIVKYLSKQLSNLINNEDEINDQLLSDTIESLLKKVKTYIYDISYNDEE